MDFQWHLIKQQSNLAKHGIDFDDATRIWDSPIIDPYRTRVRPDETRHVAVGILRGHGTTGGTILSVVYTSRNDSVRIISALKASRTERRAYRAAFG